ncbi:MAG TPA: phage portal protein [Phycisphaerae bacterium]|nr:phage portal protein [Phycisphaerae bacterium]
MRRTKPDVPGARSATWGMDRTAAGVVVNEHSVLSLSTYWACIRVLSETAALLPWHVFERQADGGRKPVPDDPAEILLHVEPNPEMGPYSFKEVMVAWAANWGNGYAEIARAANGTPLALWPIGAHNVQAVRLDGAMVYDVANPDGTHTGIPAADMYHLHGPGYDGLVGYSVARKARESIGLAKAAEQYGSSFFGNGTSPGAVITHPQTLTAPAEERLRESVRKYRDGPSNQHRLLILEDAMKWEQIGTPPEDAQFLETREFQVPDVCRWFRMPPHKVSHLNRATWANLGEQNTEFATDTMAPWTARMEEEADRKLIVGGARSGRFTRLNLNALPFRGDPKSRVIFYRQLRDLGVVDVDELRALEDMNPIGGPEGKLRLVPMNMQRLEDAAKEPEPPPVLAMGPPGAVGKEQAEPDAGEPDDEKVEALKKSTARLFAVACETVLRKEVIAAERAAKRYAEAPAGFLGWMDEFYSKHQGYVAETMRTPADALAELLSGLGTIQVYAAANSAAMAYASKHCERSRADLLTAFAAGDVSAACAAWLIARPGEAAVQLTEDLARAAQADEVTV